MRVPSQAALGERAQGLPVQAVAQAGQAPLILHLYPVEVRHELGGQDLSDPRPGARQRGLFAARPCPAPLLQAPLQVVELPAGPVQVLGQPVQLPGEEALRKRHHHPHPAALELYLGDGGPGPGHACKVSEIPLGGGQEFLFFVK